MHLARVIDFLYPPFCHLCNTPLDAGRYLCPACHGALPRIAPPFCCRCGLPHDGRLPEHFTCPNCREREFSFDFARAALLARDDARELIHAFKYRRRIHLDTTLAALTAEALDDPRLTAETAWTLVPVPLHWHRQRWRWFNQAHEIARSLRRLTGFPLVNALRRIRRTDQQILLTRRERLRNLKNAFRLSRHERKCRNLQGKQVLLVDDVFTTGSTAHECARILKAEAEVEKVVVLTTLRG